MSLKSTILLLGSLATTAILQPTLHAEDVRQGALKDLKGYFPFTPPKSLGDWQARKEEVRRRILVAEGLWPMPTKTPLNAVIHGKVAPQGENYTVEKVYFESAPGFFVTGNLYRPKNPQGKVPGVLFAHGHWQDARLALADPQKLREEIAIGAERFEKGGRSMFQSLCVQLARMGCVVWQWDMLSDSDSVQLSRELVHTFAKQRPEANKREGWGLYSPQAEAHLQSIMGLQTLNAVRGLDFLLTLPEVDPERTAITGASGGGTQTMLLAAIDDRIKLSFPCVMVSTGMQGGCTCENTSLLRIGTGNVEFAALFAPKPQGMNTANDWTKEMATKGFPELQQLYRLHGAKDHVFLLRGEHFQHNYNAVTRSAFYTFLNKHFKLGFTAPVIENDYEPLTREQLSVWDAQHPAPKAGGLAFEQSLLKWLHDDAQKQLQAAASTREGREKVLRPAVETILGRTYAQAGDSTWELQDKQDQGAYLSMTGTLQNTSHQEQLSLTWLYPKNWNSRAVIWLQAGKPDAAALVTLPEVQALLKAGTLVVAPAVLAPTGATQNRLVENPREFAGYTYGYNHALFAQRVHDVLTLIRFLRQGQVGQHPRPQQVTLVGTGSQGPVALAARALAGQAVDRAAIETAGFRFGHVLDYQDAMFLPGGAKYLDIPGLIALNEDLPLWIQGEGPAPKQSLQEWLAQ